MITEEYNFLIKKIKAVADCDFEGVEANECLCVDLTFEDFPFIYITIQEEKYTIAPYSYMNIV